MARRSSSSRSFDLARSRDTREYAAGGRRGTCARSSTACAVDRCSRPTSRATGGARAARVRATSASVNQLRRGSQGLEADPAGRPARRRREYSLDSGVVDFFDMVMRDITSSTPWVAQLRAAVWRRDGILSRRASSSVWRRRPSRVHIVSGIAGLIAGAMSCSREYVSVTHSPMRKRDIERERAARGDPEAGCGSSCRST